LVNLRIARSGVDHRDPALSATTNPTLAIAPMFWRVVSLGRGFMHTGPAQFRRRAMLVAPKAMSIADGGERNETETPANHPKVVMFHCDSARLSIAPPNRRA
jgi:hypothetical protein